MRAFFPAVERDPAAYLDSLTWDGVSRLDGIAARCLRADRKSYAATMRAFMLDAGRANTSEAAEHMRALRRGVAT